MADDDGVLELKDCKTEGHQTEADHFMPNKESELDSREDFSSRFLNMAAELFNQPKYSDIVIMLEGEQKLWGHKIVLLSRSGEWGEPGLLNTKQLDLSDISYDVGYTMMKWVYTDDLPDNLDVDFLLILLELSTRFQLQYLHIRCQKELMNFVSEENYIRMLKIAEQLNAQLLQDYCTQYLPNQDIVTVEGLSNEEVEEDIQEIIQRHDLRVEDHDTAKGHDTVKDHENQEEKFTEIIEAREIKHENIEDNMLMEIKQEPMEFIPTALNISQPRETISYPNQHSCNICGKTYSQVISLERHYKSHVNIENQYTCERCGRAFLSETGYKTHECIQFVCDVCSSAFQTQNEFEEHFARHDDVEKCEFCGKCFTNLSKLKQHIKSHQPADCPICGKHFTHHGSLKQHEKCHIHEIKCKICDKHFSSVSNLTRHENIHRGVKPYRCQECGQTFTQNNDLLRHSKIHTGELEFKCEICHRCFNRQSTLTKHRRTHTNEKPYFCQLCSKSFTNSSSLSRHMKGHNGEKSFACDVCDKRFISRTDLSRHSRVHAPRPHFQCSFCEKTFRTINDLQVHITQHSAETIEYIELPVAPEELENYKIIDNIQDS